MEPSPCPRPSLRLPPPLPREVSLLEEMKTSRTRDSPVRKALRGTLVPNQVEASCGYLCWALSPVIRDRCLEAGHRALFRVFRLPLRCSQGWEVQCSHTASQPEAQRTQASLRPHRVRGRAEPSLKSWCRPFVTEPWRFCSSCVSRSLGEPLNTHCASACNS